MQSEQLSLGQITGLLEHMPNRGYLLQQVSGTDFNWEYLKHLGRMMFSGCTFARFPSGERSFLLHLTGKLIFAHHHDHQGGIAAEYFLKDVSKATVSTFRVLPAVMILGIAPLLGQPRARDMQTFSQDSRGLLEGLRLSGFSGAVVHNYLSQVRIWYLREGRPFQSQPLPSGFEEGTLHIFEAVKEPRQDLFVELEQPKPLFSEVEPGASSGEQIWQIAQKVLDEYLGSSAHLALERMRKDIRLEDLHDLRGLVQHRLEAVLGRAAAQRFALLAQEL